jgi:hypothetical protein
MFIKIKYKKKKKNSIYLIKNFNYFKKSKKNLNFFF